MERMTPRLSPPNSKAGMEIHRDGKASREASFGWSNSGRRILLSATGRRHSQLLCCSCMLLIVYSNVSLFWNAPASIYVLQQRARNVAEVRGKCTRDYTSAVLVTFPLDVRDHAVRKATPDGQRTVGSSSLSLLFPLCLLTPALLWYPHKTNLQHWWSTSH